LSQPAFSGLIHLDPCARQPPPVVFLALVVRPCVLTSRDFNVMGNAGPRNFFCSPDLLFIRDLSTLSLPPFYQLLTGELFGVVACACVIGDLK
jgi:hypothetical protein